MSKWHHAHVAVWLNVSSLSLQLLCPKSTQGCIRSKLKVGSRNGCAPASPASSSPDWRRSSHGSSTWSGPRGSSWPRLCSSQKLRWESRYWKCKQEWCKVQHQEHIYIQCFWCASSLFFLSPGQSLVPEPTHQVAQTESGAAAGQTGQTGPGCSAEKSRISRPRRWRRWGWGVLRPGRGYWRVWWLYRPLLTQHHWTFEKTCTYSRERRPVSPTMNI